MFHIVSRLASTPIRERTLLRLFPDFSTSIPTPVDVAVSDSVSEENGKKSVSEESPSRQLGEDLERRRRGLGLERGSEVGKRLGFLGVFGERGRTR